MTVETLDVVTSLSVPADRVLKAAIGHLDYVVVLGWDKDGERYVALSGADIGKALLILEKARQDFLSQVP